MKTIAQIGLDCVGCRSCEQSCPQKCIAIEENSEGFLYPVIQEADCVKCGICLKKCPISKEIAKKREPLEAFALKAKDIEFLRNSASGGASDLAVSAILDRGGYVYGAAYDENNGVCHIEVSDEEGRKKIQSSKYVQSDLRDTFSKAKARLETGTPVLFTGTPCQIAGLYSFLGKNYENLYTIDLICHGVPSPRFLKKYFEYQEKKLNEQIVSFNFRSKDKRGWGTQYLLKTKTKTKTKTKILALDKYGKHFMDGDCYRESCYRCRYTNLNRPGDLTVGDFWGVHQSHPEFFSPDGVSTVLVNTETGGNLLDAMRCKADVLPITMDAAVLKQRNLKQPTVRNEERNTFYTEMNSENFIRNMKVGLCLRERIKVLIPPKVVVFLKKLH